MTEIKLPFVWELNNGGVISHTIGSPHGVDSLFHSQFDKYTHQILQYMANKGLVLTESENSEGGTLDAAVTDIARAMELPIKEISTEIESEIFEMQYSTYLKGRQAFELYKKGDDEALKKLYGEPDQSLKEYNENTASRSLRWLKAAPSLMIVNLARLLLKPSLISILQKKGINARRIQ